MKDASIKNSILSSWDAVDEGLCSTAELEEWIVSLNNTTEVEIHETPIQNSDFWFYDDYSGEILNRRRSFFSVKGIRWFVDDEFICEQPMIIQPEIGFLGIIVTRIDGVMYFLIQAKIEPGNINHVQLSPTLQATKSNFTRVHGGKLPLYFRYFENSEKYNILYDCIQSEQNSRFLHKRNRNIIIEIDEKIEKIGEHPNFRWMTLGQISYFLKKDNLVNMDTRTVLSGLFSALDGMGGPGGNPVLGSIGYTDPGETLAAARHGLNQYKMFNEISQVMVPLNELVDWKVTKEGRVYPRENRKIKSEGNVSVCNFEVAFYDISISGREVQSWSQPLFKSIGIACFGLLARVVRGHEDGGRVQFLVKLCPEMGCIDKVELGPCIQKEYTSGRDLANPVEKLFWKKYDAGKNILANVLLSEEGGRFYQEQNRNVIILVEDDELPELPGGYYWMDYSALSRMVCMQYCLNIQLRNMMTLVDKEWVL